MSSGNFERCLAVVLKWEGGYSNHPDDPGGPTMRGVTQVEYDKWRTLHRKRRKPVREIGEDELKAIYRANYWDAVDCENLVLGFDLCVFDAAVNSGPARARLWLRDGENIDIFCDARLAFLQQTGRLWRIFGQGWRRRVSGIRAEAHRMSGSQSGPEFHDATLHPGMTGPEVRELQSRLRALGYPCGTVDGIYGEQTYRAVVLFQHDHDLQGDPGIWQPDYLMALDTAQPMLPKRKDATARDLDCAGDEPLKRMNLLQRILAWFFGASAVAQVCDGSNALETMTAARSALQPVQELLEWTSGHRWLLLALICAGLIALIRQLRASHVKAFQNFDYQGQMPVEKK